MRVGISNMAWDTGEDAAIADLLGQHGVNAIDVAPAKYFPEPAQARDTDVQRVRQWWQEHGVEIVGMQGLLFGTAGLNLFGTAAVQAAMLEHLAHVARIGAGLGARWLVFGSPRNRDRTGLSDAAARAMAMDFFRRLGDIVANEGLCVTLEPNPSCYGSNFMTTSDETARVVTAVAHPAIRMHLDVGAMVINGEDVDAILVEHGHLIGHVHASEPGLVPLGDGGADHARAGLALARHLPDHVVTIEMLATGKEPHASSVARALAVAMRCYRQPGDIPEIQ